MPIHFLEAIPIAVAGLFVNIISAWLLNGGDHHSPGHAHDHAHPHAEHDHEDEPLRIITATGSVDLSIFGDGLPPRFTLRFSEPSSSGVMNVETRPNGQRQMFSLENRGDYWESTDMIRELTRSRLEQVLPRVSNALVFEEHAHEHRKAEGPARAALRDNSIRCAYFHVIGDAVDFWPSTGWCWLSRSTGCGCTPLAGIVGALVIAYWPYSMLRDTAGSLLDMFPDPALVEQLLKTVESYGSRQIDVHLWPLGPGHLGAIASVVTRKPRNAAFYALRSPDSSRYLVSLLK